MVKLNRLQCDQLVNLSQFSLFLIAHILLTASGTFHDGDFLLNQKGLKLTPINVLEKNQFLPSDCKELDFEITAEDLETMRVIGKGSSGVVQLVRHKWVGNVHFYELQVIQMNIQEKIRKQIVQELKINQASSQCPHVAVCYHSFYHNGAFSLVLEYMDRGSLVDVIRQVKTILEPYLAVVCKQVLQGLVYLHNERHVIHRDIKPSNLLVNHKGDVNIHDHVFFYSFTLQPERISGSTYDYSSDIWSLGMSVLECAIGRFPYLESEDQQNPPSFYELLAAIIESPPPTAPSVQFSPEFCSFVSACLQKDPPARASSLDLLSHPFIKKFEDMDIDLGVLVGTLEPPVNCLR
uniref:mitogen-activated protein kinase kinase n=2 Tax=Brassica TaxID=3705 RepID=A0A3P6E2K0_BRAOL|nr:unnamed protein product [Brassica oleracea]